MPPYKASSDELLRQVDPVSILSSNPPTLDAPPFPPFLHETTRKPGEKINDYLLLINADIKFRRLIQSIGLDKLHPEIKVVVEQTIKIVDLMYTRPVRSESCTAVAAGARVMGTRTHKTQLSIFLEEKASLRWKQEVALARVGEKINFITWHSGI